MEQYRNVIGTVNLDLTAFRDPRGQGDPMAWLADQLISAEGRIDYYKRVQQTMGGSKKASEFARLFLAP